MIYVIIFLKYKFDTINKKRHFLSTVLLTKKSVKGGGGKEKKSIV